MLSFEHRVRRQSLTLRCPDEALALELRPRARSLNQTLLLPTIEAVLREFDGADGMIQIGRLELELGELSIDELDERLSLRLATALREAILAALADRAATPMRTGDEARAALLAHYLARGTWPAWAPRAGALSAELLLLEMAEVDGAGLVALLRSLAGRRVVLERLVTQLSVVGLERLVGLLEPSHAQLVVVYLFELESSHRFSPLVRLGDSAFHRVVWVFSLAYLIREHGTQFNRKTFVKRLIGELAREWGLAYDELLAALWRGLEQLEQGEPLRSLPAVVDTLVGELALLRRPDPEPADRSEPPPDSIDAVRAELRAARGFGRDRLALLLVRLAGISTLAVESLAAMLIEELGAERTMAALIWSASPALARDRFAELLLALFAAGPVDAADALRAAGDLDQVLGVVVERLETASLRELVAKLEPDHAVAVNRYVDEFEARQRERPIVPLPTPTFMALVWRLTLAYLVRSPGTQFNRLRYVESLVRGLAGELGLDYEVLLEALHHVLVELDRAGPLRSLPAVLDELIHHDQRRRPADTMRPMPGLAPAHARYDRLRTLAGFLVDDDWPWEDLVDTGGAPPLDPGHTLNELLAWPLLVQTLFPAEPRSVRARAVARAMDLLDERGRGRLATVLKLEAGLAALTDPRSSVATLASLATPERGFEASHSIAALLAELGDGGQRTVLRASERTLFRTQLRHRPELALAFLARLHASHERWSQRMLGDPEFTREIIVALAGRRVAQAVDLLADLGDELLGRPPDLRWRLSSSWLAAAAAGRSATLQIRQMVELLPISRDRIAEISTRVADACAVDPVSPIAVELLRDALHEAWSRAGTSTAKPEPGLGASPNPVGPDQPTLEQLLDIAKTQLSGSTPAIKTPERALDEALDLLATHQPGALADLIEAELHHRRTRERWTTQLSEPTLARIVELVAPRQARQLLAAAELLAGCWAELGPGRGRAWLWTTMLEFLANTSRLDRNVPQFVQFVFARALIDANREQRDRLWTRARERAVEVGQGSLRAALRARPQTLAANRKPGRPRSSLPASSDPMYLDNAGLTLLGPFLPVWMSRLGLSDDPSKSPNLDLERASKAVHLLQWMVDGRCDVPEPGLVLNKILCGLPLEHVVLPRHEPTAAEIAVCEQLLSAVIQHWGTIGNTSIAGLRETFLQREGRLEQTSDHWSLKVQRKTVDVLVDQIPWTTSIIALAWMPRSLHVSW